MSDTNNKKQQLTVQDLMNKFSDKLQLNCDTVDCMPVDVNWQELAGENCEGWKAVQPSTCFEQDNDGDQGDYINAYNAWRCKDCEARFENTLTYNNGDDSEYEGCPWCESDKIEEYGVPQPESLNPMMDYYYPINLSRYDAQEIATIIDETGPLTLIEFSDGNHGLALTGGGMDLSWEICEVFVAIGFLPPVHFCKLPNVAGKDYDSEKTQLVIAACAKSCEVKQRWVQNNIDDLNRLLERNTK